MRNDPTRSTRENYSRRRQIADLKEYAHPTNHMKKLSLLLTCLALSVLAFATGTNHGFNALFGPLFHPGSGVPPLVGPSQGLDSLHRWNTIALNATGLDHTPVAPGD